MLPCALTAGRGHAAAKDEAVTAVARAVSHQRIVLLTGLAWGSIAVDWQRAMDLHALALLAQQTPADAPAAPGGVWEIVLSGGWVGLLILLLLFALSISAAYLAFDQAMTLRRREILPDGLADRVRQALLTGRLADADAACRREPSVLSFVLLNGLGEIEFGWREVEKAVEDALAEQAARLMRRIEYLSVIGNIAPMVGLLGTVTGMIFAFQQVAGSQGAAGAGDLAEGIYQALVTTVGGLIVAIPSLGAFAICRNRVDALIAEAAYQTQHALTPVKRRPQTRAKPPAPRAPSPRNPPPAGATTPPGPQPPPKQ